MFSLISAWTNSWINNRDAGDLRRHRTHYDVAAMSQVQVQRVYNTHDIDDLQHHVKKSLVE